jgi:hypothetical protein
MALHDNPPHAVDAYALASSRDPGGGTQSVYTPAQSGVPCSIDTASAAEVERFAQMQQVVTHKLAFLATALTAPLTRGMKLVAADSGETFHVKGIAAGRAYGTIPPFVYAFCESLN